MNEKLVRKKIKEHWKVFSAAISLGVIAVIGAVLVLIWFVESSDIGLQGTLTIDQWSVATVLWFCINLVLWELLFVGLPAGIIFGAGGYLWWNSLTVKEKREFKSKDKKGRDSDGFMSFLFSIAYIIYIAVDGNFYTPLGDLPYSYWLYACLWTMAWLLILVGIPMGVIAVVYYSGWFKKS